MKKYFLLLLAVLLLSACRTEYVAVPVVQTDTCYIAKMQRDSVHIHDSIHVREAGDSVIITRWLTRYRERQRVDTLIEVHIDSVPVPVEVIKEVPAELTWWQRWRMNLGDMGLMVLAVLTVIGIVKLIKRRGNLLP